MQPEVMVFMAGIVFAVVKAVQVWVVYDNREEEE